MGHGRPKPADRTARAAAVRCRLVYAALDLEVDEDQHRRPVAFWDKHGVATLSGVHRGQQRAMYDRHKRTAAREQGFTVIEIPWERRPRPGSRNRENDRRYVEELLRNAGVSL